MIVLTRKTGQGLILEGGIRIAILDVKGDSVRLAIQTSSDGHVLGENPIDCARSTPVPADDDASPCSCDESPYHAEFA